MCVKHCVYWYLSETTPCSQEVSGSVIKKKDDATQLFVVFASNCWLVSENIGNLFKLFNLFCSVVLVFILENVFFWKWGL